jgi:hypothetical protein
MRELMERDSCYESADDSADENKRSEGINFKKVEVYEDHYGLS